jgi:UDP-N-acetylmuramyl pentapeptide phosphotransferase/UDP-N-acetylglucosamine-1-phosphate transferase
MKWLEWLTPAVLFVTTTFGYLDGQYGMAIVCAACAGFCLGLACARYVIRHYS